MREGPSRFQPGATAGPGSQVGSHSLWTDTDGCGRRWVRNPCAATLLDSCGRLWTAVGDPRIRRPGLRNDEQGEESRRSTGETARGSSYKRLLAFGVSRSRDGVTYRPTKPPAPILGVDLSATVPGAVGSEGSGTIPVWAGGLLPSLTWRLSDPTSTNPAGAGSHAATPPVPAGRLGFAPHQQRADHRCLDECLRQNSVSGGRRVAVPVSGSVGSS